MLFGYSSKGLPRGDGIGEMSDELQNWKAMKKPMYPRDSAGSFRVPSAKTDAIVEMCPLTGFMEIYTPTETFKLQTPESIDPERTNPNAPWVNVKTHDVGSTSPYVARTLITASRLLHPLGNHDEQRHSAVLELMHGIKETLLQCAAASDAFCRSVEEAASALDSSGYKKAAGANALEVFPVVQDLNGKSTAFLISARRLITEVCRIPALFLPMERSHSSLEHLLEKDLYRRLGEEHGLVKFLEPFIPGTKRLIELRNGQEHATTTKGRALEVHNFEHVPSGQVRHPVWFLQGDEPEDIYTTMKSVPDFLVNLAEGMFVGALHETLPKWPPFFISPIDEPDPQCPVRYHMDIDISALSLKENEPKN